MSDDDEQTVSFVDLAMEVEEPESDPTKRSDPAFKEKLASIQFPGRGRADRTRQITDHGRRVNDAERRRRES